MKIDRIILPNVPRVSYKRWDIIDGHPYQLYLIDVDKRHWDISHISSETYNDLKNQIIRFLRINKVYEILSCK